MKIVLLVVLFLMPIYTYLLFPLILALIGLFRRERTIIDELYCPMVSVVIAAYNEESVIEAKIDNLLSTNYPSDKIEFLVGSDGSTDRTAELMLGRGGHQSIRCFVLPRGGKVATINALLREARGEIVVFSDANTMYDEKAISKLVRHFADSMIGCVSGQLRYKVEKGSGDGAVSESAYWKYENRIKILESRLGCISGANGAIYAVRRQLIPRIDEKVINDDFFLSMKVLERGCKVILDTEAVAYEKPNDDMGSQIARHIRDGAGHYQALARLWRMLLFRRGGFVYFSHRVIRWLVPFALIIAYFYNALICVDSILLATMFSIQTIGYLLLICYSLLKKRGRWSNRYADIIQYFFLVNLSLLIGFANLAMGRQKAKWETQR
jgi:poly-beta-1,6-N-acetyl-D-glucosamine synthase